MRILKNVNYMTRAYNQYQQKNAAKDQEKEDTRFADSVRENRTATEKPKKMQKTTAVTTGTTPQNPVYQAVLEGEKELITAYAKAEVEKGLAPEVVINDLLIPAITQVGQLYNDQVYFLPQLIASANAMETAIHYLEPQIKKSGDEKQLPAIVVATVEGDVHDIGKNLVALMLRNYGYDVIDLGKDVPAQVIIDKAIDTGAAIVGLSALMTTTMMHMKDVIAEAAKRHYTGKIIIGGAAVTPSFATEIGADGYSSDAADCVRLVGSLLA